MENRHYQITRCPNCKSADLTAIYYQEPERTGCLAFLAKWSIIGIIKQLIFMRNEDKKINQQTYWQCNCCGATFPANEQ